MKGFWDAKMYAYYTNRILSAEAKTTLYDETVEAFRSHYDDRGLWQGEYWGKTMLSAVAVQAMTRDEELKKWIVEKALAFVKEFQRADGYLCTYTDPNNTGPNPDGVEKFNWNLWGRKYTMWALVEISWMLEREVTFHQPGFRADKTLLAAAMRIMDHEISQFAETNVKIDKTGCFAGLPTMSVLKPLMLLYRRTGKTEYIDFAAKLVKMWERDGNPPPNLIVNAFGDKPVHEWYPNPGWWAKAYEMMSCLEGILDYADWTHDRRLVDAVARIAEKLQDHEGNPFGSVGYFDHFTNAKACPNATTEICDAIHWMRLCRDLFRATGEAKHLDRMENAFLNGFLPGVFRDGKWAAHGTRSHGTRQFTAPRQINMKHHQCCVDNACRTWLNLYESSAAMNDDGTAYANLYFKGNYAVYRGKDGFNYVVHGDDLLKGKLVLQIRSGVSRPVKFRAPAWAEDFKVNGVAATNGWVTTCFDTKKPNGTWYTATYKPKLVLHEWKTEKGADPRPGLFEQTGTTPEMKGLARKEGAAYLTYGPFLLAKSTLAGDTMEECLDFKSVLGKGYSVSLAPITSDKVKYGWKATFTKGEEKFSVNVCDLQSCDIDDPGGAYSIWF